MPYLILPFCENGSSVKLTGKIDERIAWVFLRDVASGLAYLHSQSPPVIHQDIKPDNVLMDSSDSFVITDFGISAKVRNTLQSAESKAGTMTYMAPERFGADYQPIKASDVWALGASLYELMTGKPPFGDNGGLAQKGGAEIILSGKWSPKLKEMAFKCLQHKTWDRPTAKAIVDVANRYLEEGPDPPKRWNFPVVLALTGICLFGLVAGFFAGSYLYKSESNPKLHECIQLIEHADTIFDENELATWREAFAKYQEAKELIEQHSLQLPSMEHRIRQMQKKMDDLTNLSLENAQKAIEVRSEMALFAIKDALEIDPGNEKANALYEQYKQLFPNSK
jgi:serine/threonine protein kinase